MKAKVWHHQLHLGTCQKCTFLDSTPETLSGTQQSVISVGTTDEQALGIEEGGS